MHVATLKAGIAAGRMSRAKMFFGNGAKQAMQEMIY